MLQVLAGVPAALYVAGCLPPIRAIAGFVAAPLVAPATVVADRIATRAVVDVVLTAAVGFAAFLATGAEETFWELKVVGLTLPGMLETVVGARATPRALPGSMEIGGGLPLRQALVGLETRPVAQTALRTTALSVEPAILRLPAIHATPAATGPTY
ncbi:unnamed protein product [Prorocentrum cordatum]|uniref:Mannosyltransferase n=1 Tax=Prorocentrum cordatum TaxID=2364126 RepID=A0ABN9UEA3_9DINO|nr:unnamed protein product [Polarella glacialis]